MIVFNFLNWIEDSTQWSSFNNGLWCLCQSNNYNESNSGNSYTYQRVDDQTARKKRYCKGLVITSMIKTVVKYKYII